MDKIEIVVSVMCLVILIIWIRLDKVSSDLEIYKDIAKAIVVKIYRGDNNDNTD